MTNQFSMITELPGTLGIDIQLRHTHQRYMVAKKYCDSVIIHELM